ncbi:Uncharacterized protein C20orf195, partial [Colius striatus]
YLERKHLVLQYVQSELNLLRLQHHRAKAELLQKSYFYLEIKPKQVNLKDQDNMMYTANLLDVTDHVQLQRIKKLGKNQTEIQLTLLTELLEQLEQGQEELNSYVRACDIRTFLSQWDLIKQKMAKLSTFVETLLSVEEPGKLHIKHRLLSSVYLRDTEHPPFSVSLYTRAPLIFDRRESFAHKKWAKLKWFSEDQDTDLQWCELHLRLLTEDRRREAGHSRIQTVFSNTCIIKNLQPGRSYEFTVRRQEDETLVYENWHDSIVLKTKSDAVE